MKFSLWDSALKITENIHKLNQDTKFWLCNLNFDAKNTK